MEASWKQRTRALLGEEAVERLAHSRVAVLGLGGVGGAAAESLCRAGVGHLLLIDSATVSDSNRNRQLIATVQTVGQPKIQAACERLRQIAPEGEYDALSLFLLPETMQPLFDWKPDGIIDAIDTISTKIALARACRERGIPLFMSMGTGGRLDPTRLRTGTLADTGGSGCALARILRRQLKAEGLLDLPVVYSLELPSHVTVTSEITGRHPPSSSPFVPPAAGFALASMAVRQLIAANDAKF